MQHVLRLMGRPADAKLSPEIAHEICERTCSTAVLEGSIANLGSQYVVGLSAKACRSGNTLDREQVQAARKKDVLNALGQVATRFRTRIGESLAKCHRRRGRLFCFQKIIDHRGIIGPDPIAALAHLQLAVRSRYREIKPGQRPPIGTSSRVGKMPTRTSRLSSKPSRNTPSCSEARYESVVRDTSYSIEFGKSL